MDVRVYNKMNRDFSIGLRPNTTEVNGKKVIVPVKGGSRLSVKAGMSAVCSKDQLEEAVKGNIALQAYIEEKKLLIMPVMSSERTDIDTDESTKLVKPDNLANPDKVGPTGKPVKMEVTGIESAEIPDAPKGGKKK